MATALASRRKKSSRTKPAFVNIKGRPGGGYLHWVKVPRASKPDLNLQVRWNLFGLPIGVVVYPPNTLYLGKLVVLMRGSTDLSTTKQPRHTFVESAYELLRQTGHITSGYVKEVDALHTARKIAREANRVTLTTGDASSVEAHQATMARLLAAFEEQVNERVRDQDKVEARMQMAASVTLTDKAGRLNPRAMAARTQAAVGRVTRRSIGATGISARILKRRVVAESLIDFAAQFVFLPARSLATMFTSEFQNLQFSPDHRDSLVARCADIARLSRLIDWRPHARLASLLAAELDDAINMIRQNNMGMVLAHFTIINEICDLYVAQKQLHTMISEFHNPLLHDPPERIAVLAVQLESFTTTMRDIASAVLRKAEVDPIVKRLNDALERLYTVRPPVRLCRGLSDKQFNAVVRDLREAGRLL